MKIYKTDANEIRVDTEDAMLGALVSSLVAQGYIEWKLKTPADVAASAEEVYQQERENCLFWVSLRGVE